MAKLRIRELAQERNINQSQLQRISGVTTGMLRRYWENDTESVNLEALDLIAAALGVMVPDLFVPEVVQFPEKPTRKPEIEAKIWALLALLPENYPKDRELIFHPKDEQYGHRRGYALTIDGTTIYRGQIAEEALERTRRYVAERDGAPYLPVGVINGIYD